MLNKEKKVYVLLLIILTSCFVNVIISQDIKSSFDHYSFMDKLPRDYSYYLSHYNETVNIINDSSILWCDKEFPYWRFLVANVALLEPDSVIKQIWNAAYSNSPHSACGFYSFIFERSFDSGYLARSPIVYYYLHNEKPYFDSICDKLFSAYNQSIVEELKVIITDDHGRGVRDMNEAQFIRDSINQIKLAKIIKHIGKYPGRSVVGNNLDDVAWLVIQHAPLKYQERYLPLIIEAVNNKDLKPMYLAYTIDRINMFKELPQIYGTQYTFENEIKILYPVKNIDSVDLLRKSVGLGGLKEYLVENSIIIK